MKLKEVVVVTGGASGLGRDIAAHFLTSECSVAIIDFNQGFLDVAHEEMRQAGALLAIQADVSDAAQVKTSFARVIAEFGRIDILVNCAGGSFGVSQEIEHIAEEDWDKVFAINCKGTFLCAREVIPGMKERRYGRIINFSSMAGRSRSLFGSVAYSAAKAAILGFTRQGSKELGPFNITMNAVAPGFILSGNRLRDFWATRKTEEERKAFLASVPVGRPGENHEIVKAVDFLASKDASYVTGAAIDVNGGVWVG